MQTFLPYEDFDKSAHVLDRQRLGKQRVETLQILKTIVHGGGWRNHPAVRMWRPHVATLLGYQVAVCNEWVSRGYKGTCLAKSFDLVPEEEVIIGRRPPWLGDEAFHLSHRSNLLRKNPDHYRQFWPTERDDLEYVWPTS